MHGSRLCERDLLRPQVLLDRHRVVGAALDRRVVGDDHALAPAHPPDAGDDPGAGRVAVVHARARPAARAPGTARPCPAGGPRARAAAACRATCAARGPSRRRPCATCSSCPQSGRPRAPRVPAIGVMRPPRHDLVARDLVARRPRAARSRVPSTGATSESSIFIDSSTTIASPALRPRRRPPSAPAAPTRASAPAAPRRRAPACTSSTRRLGHVPASSPRSAIQSASAYGERGAGRAQVRSTRSKRLAAVDRELPVGRGALAAEPPAVAALATARRRAAPSCGSMAHGAGDLLVAQRRRRAGRAAPIRPVSISPARTSSRAEQRAQEADVGVQPEDRGVGQRAVEPRERGAGGRGRAR